ncbi:uncharacterized protein LOC110440826, partial [Mizuhopecten yessoensis]|uniref:uncharacterized protein LOC110440826 n=1 Tax=Mizuhopecten yessoensis TaxID=6573 RepID=UPI000B4572C4
MDHGGPNNAGDFFREDQETSGEETDLTGPNHVGDVVSENQETHEEKRREEGVPNPAENLFGEKAMKTFKRRAGWKPQQEQILRSLFRSQLCSCVRMAKVRKKAGALLPDYTTQQNQVFEEVIK